MLTTGSRLGPYEVLGPLGSGGMGEVYRARDTRLDRIVAIKALPQSLSGAPESLARFEREAKLLASLNHPNIASIYGLEEVEGVPYLVLEFIEGRTLAQALVGGTMEVRQTLDVGGQIAAAIEAAHERGIVHRDLKPGNVMITTSGTVKVLDFGLAKGGTPGTPSSMGLSATPTMAVAGTRDGIILGTAPYMSPEQARGKAVDGRTDVWAFGCVLFECLSGRQAFHGETVSDVIAGILAQEPDWNLMPPAAPLKLRDLVRRCLTKESDKRPRGIGDLRLELLAIAQEMSAPSSRSISSEVPSLAVLYFENLSADKESDYFCAGITEDILTDLSKIKGLRVASRNAVARYRGESVDLGKVAAELGVKAVLEGSVRRAGDRVRISAQLINGADGFHMWAERFDRTLEDVFAVQEEIASSIAQALRVKLTPAEAEALVQDRPADVRAYDLYLKGRQHYELFTPEGRSEALELFQQAVEVDPNYALAWAGIADCYGQMLQLDSTPDWAENGRLGLEAARRAIGLNPNLAEAHKAEALVLRFSGDLEGSRASLRRAVEANPRYVSALTNMAVDRYCLGDLAGAERLIRRGLELEPQGAFGYLWIGYLMSVTDRYAQVPEVARKMGELSASSTFITGACALHVRAAVARGDLPAAHEAIRAARAQGAHELGLQGMQAYLASHEGHEDEARKYVLGVKGFEGMGLLVAPSVVDAAIRVGEIDLAKFFLARRLMVDMAPTVVRLDPDLHPLLDMEPFAPRVLDATLVWPLEAPMLKPSVHALFREVRIESGLPQGSNIFPKS